MAALGEKAERKEDQSPDGELVVLRSTIGDISVGVKPSRHRTIPQMIPHVEFCVIGVGRGRSPRTMIALDKLIDAMNLDNKENPEYVQPELLTLRKEKIKVVHKNCGHKRWERVGSTSSTTKEIHWCTKCGTLRFKVIKMCRGTAKHLGSKIYEYVNPQSY